MFYNRVDHLCMLLGQAARAQRLAVEAARDPQSLALHGYSVYSQHDEDGIIEEIFRRIGTSNKIFVEIGCGNGLENNTTHLLLTGWQGIWIDGAERNIASIQERMSDYVASGKLCAGRVLITAENVNEALMSRGCAASVDLLSIDIDGNDYWIWSALEAVVPRVVVIEYNAAFRPPHKVVQRYDPSYVWDGSNYYGASLEALAELGRQKGYSLVATCEAGVNAFFVRDDLVQAGGRFSPPFSAQRHYHPDNVASWPRGRVPGTGPYVCLDEQAGPGRQ